MEESRPLLSMEEGLKKGIKKPSKSKPTKRADGRRNGIDKSMVLKKFVHESGKLEGVTLVLGARQAQRSEPTSEEKALIAQTKKRGACPRCRQLKGQCRYPPRPFLPCLCCWKSKPTYLNLPCTLREKLIEIQLCRPGPAVDNPDHPLRFADHVFKPRAIIPVSHRLPSSDSGKDRCIQLYQGVDATFPLDVCLYLPLPGDRTAYEWTTPDGTINSMSMPSYCISDIREASTRMHRYIIETKDKYINEFMDRKDPLISKTFDAARQSKSRLVQLALLIWSSSRLIEETWTICGEDTLDIPTVTDQTNPWRGLVPVTPIMDQQLDQIVIKTFIQPLTERFLGELNNSLYPKNQSSPGPFDIYLAIFIIINNSAVQLRSERRFALRYGFSGRYGPIGQYFDAETVFHAAKTMLAHFHYVFDGPSRLLLDPNSRDTTISDPTWKRYVEEMKPQVENREQELRQLHQTHSYESGFYWCGQMFYKGWEAGPVQIEEVG